jgi:putative intracellular protease/amidase
MDVWEVPYSSCSGLDIGLLMDVGPELATLIAHVFDGNAEGVTRDDVLDTITLYWLTNTANSSARLYWAKRLAFFEVNNVAIPVAVNAFPDEFYQAPPSWAEPESPKLIHYNCLGKGGHFAARELLEIFTEELRAAFSSLRYRQPDRKIRSDLRVHPQLHDTHLRSLTMKILMVLTSHDQLGNTGRKTGFWLEEFAAPYFTFLDAAATVTVASPKGGQPPLDPISDTPEGQTELTRRFKQDPAAQAVLANTVRLSDVKASDYDAVFYPGGHGPMWDLAEDPRSIALIEDFYSSGKPVAAVCHAPGVLHRVQFQGQPIVKAKRVTGFTNGEEEAVHLTKVVPFLVEDELKRLGGLYEKAANWVPFVVTDGKLVTGQNPASSKPGAEALLKLLV